MPKKETDTPISATLQGTVPEYLARYVRSRTELLGITIGEAMVEAFTPWLEKTVEDSRILKPDVPEPRRAQVGGKR